MKIIEIFHYLNSFNSINEGLSLSDLRKKIIKGEVKISSDESEWYDNDKNKESLINILGSVVGPNANKELNNKLKSLDTDNYYKKGVIKPKSLRKDLKNKISLIKAKSDYEKSKFPIEDQYEMYDMGNGVELYSVFTPTANTYLSFNLLKSSQTPTWCIASPTSSFKFWSRYELWKAPVPLVFILLKRGKTNIIKKDKYGEKIYDENDEPIMEEVINLKYEMRLNPEKTQLFSEDLSYIEDIVEECRDAYQHEQEYDETSIYDYIDISQDDLIKAIKKLLKSPKGKSFSEKFGKNRYDRIKNNIISDNEDLKQESLLGACQMGCLLDFSSYIAEEDVDFYIENCINYNTLFEDELFIFEKRISSETAEKCIASLIKNKRCTNITLKFCNDKKKQKYFNRVLEAMDKKSYGWGTLMEIVRSDDDKSLEKVINVLAIQNDSHEINLGILKNKRKYFDMYLNILIKHDNFDSNIINITTQYASDIQLKKIITSLIKKSKFGPESLRVLYKNNKKYLIPFAVDILRKNDGLDSFDLSVFIEYKDYDMIKMAVDSIIENDYCNSTAFDILIKAGYKDYANRILDAIINGKDERYMISSFLTHLSRYDDSSYFEKALNMVLEKKNDLMEEYYINGYLIQRNSEITKSLFDALIKHEWKPLITLKIALNWGIDEYILPIVQLLKKKNMLNDTARELLANKNKLDVLEKLEED